MKTPAPHCRQIRLPVWLLPLVLVLTFSIAVHAQSGTTSNGFIYLTSGTTVSITGYVGIGGSVSIPSTITAGTNSLSVVSIGPNAFNNCLSLTGLTIPTSVTNTGSAAFYGCSNLTSITIPNSVTSLGDFSFYGCTSATSVTIGSGVTNTGNDTFNSCSSLISVTLPVSLVTIGNDAFENCSSLTTLPLPAGVVTLGTNAFNGCSSVVTATIPASVTTISPDVFLNCSSLTTLTVTSGNKNYISILGVLFSTGTTTLFQYPPAKAGSVYSIPNGVQTISGDAFNGCTTLVTGTIPASVTSIGAGAFLNCPALAALSVAPANTVFSSSTNGTVKGAGAVLFDFAKTKIIRVPESCPFLNGTVAGSYTIPASVTTIGNDAFYGCSTLTGTFTISHGVITIGTDAFMNCTNVKTVNIADTVTSIGDYAFNACTSATNITMADNVTNIGDYAFAQCISASTIRISTSDTNIGQHAFDACSSLGSIIIPNKVVTIGAAAFYSCTNASTLSIGSTVSTIGDFAFYGCPVTQVTIPSTVTFIGSEAFMGSSTLTQIKITGSNSFYTAINGVLFDSATTTLIEYPPGAPSTVYLIPPSVTNIGPDAFFGCVHLVNVTGMVGVTSIGPDAFNGSSSLTSVTFPAGLTSIGDDAFLGCSLSTVSIPSTVTSIGNYAFSGCLMTSATIPNGITAVSNGLFFSCTNLNVVTIPSTVTSIGSDAFANCPLTSTNIPNAVTSIGDFAYSGCANLTNINIPNSVTSLGNYAFYSCTSATTLMIGNNVSNIGNDSFYGCIGLTSVTIPASVAGIGNDAFNGCIGLTNVTIPNSVTSIGSEAFESCASLTSMIIPSSVTSIGTDAFTGCSNLASAFFMGNAPSADTTIFSAAASNFVIYYMNGATGWTNPWNGYPTGDILPPTASTTAATLTTSTSTTLNGTVNPNGLVITSTCYFQYGLTGTYGTNTGMQISGTGTTAMPFSAGITGLTPSTPYHFRIVAFNLSGTSYGSDQTVTTNPLLPVATTGSATGITYNAATLNGTVNPSGGSTTYYFQYGTTIAYGTSTATLSAGSGTATLPFSAAVTGLNYSTIYHFQLVAINISGTTFGADNTFITSNPPPPTIFTGSATGITYDTATLNGSVTPNGEDTTCFFEYGTTTSYGMTTVAQDAGSGTTGTAASATLSGLTASTKYYFRLTGSSVGGLIHGSGSNFTTANVPPKPVATTGSAIGTTFNTTTLTGTVTPSNGADTTYYFEYGTSTSYGTNTLIQDSGTIPTALPVSAPVSNLNYATTYHFQLVASSTSGTVYGGDKTVRTADLPVPPIAITGSATTTSTTAVLSGTVTPSPGADTTYFFEYGTTTSYGTISTKQDAGSVATATPIGAALTGLTGTTIYHYQLVASSTSGTVYGGDQIFTTENYPPPTVTTGIATVPTYGAAIVTGTVIPNDLPTNVYFVSGTSTAYGAATPTQAIGSGSNPIACTAEITGFQAGVLYHYCLVGVNSSGTTYGSDVTFSRPIHTNADLSALKLSAGAFSPAFAASGTSYTLNVSNRIASTTITATSATTTIVGMNLSDNGKSYGALKSGKASGTLPFNAGGYSNSIDVNVIAEDGSTVETYAITVNRVALPVTESPSAIGSSTATLEAAVDGHGTSVAFNYGLTKTYGSTTKPVEIVSSSGTQQASATLTGLAPATLYHYRVAVTTGSLTDYGTDLTFTTDPVRPANVVAVQSGTAIGVTNTKYFSFGNPAINEPGDVAFEAVVSGDVIKVANYSAIFVESASSGAVNEIANTSVSAAAPDAMGITGSIGNFATLGDPVFNNNGEVAFLATLKIGGATRVTLANDRGIWANSSGTLCLVAREGQTVTTTGSLNGTKFASFSQLALPDSGGPVFLADLAITPGKVTAKNNQGIWTTSTNEMLQLLVGTGQPLVGGTIASLSIFAAPTGVAGQTRSFDSAGDLIFNATLTSGSQGVYIRMADGTISPVANKGEGTPPTSGTTSTGQSFSALSSPIVNGLSHAAFYATISGVGVNATNNTGIWAETTETGTTAILGEVVRTGDPAPNASGSVGALAIGTFSTLGNPVSNDNDDVAFIGTLKISGTVTTLNNHGIWLWTGSTGTLAQLARSQQAAGGCSGAVFSSFSELALPDTGGVVVLANLVGKGITVANNQGLWMIDANGQSTLIARKGDVLVVDTQNHTKTISTLSIFSATAGVGGQTRSFNSAGELVYKVTFTDRTQAIYKVVSP